MRPLELVILVDDDDADNHIHRRAIQRSGLVERTKVFTSALDALAFFRDTPEPTALVLLDIHMPVMTGFEFLEEYNKLPRASRAEVTLVMLTSSDARQDSEAAELYSVNGFESKPLTTARFRELVEANFPDRR